MKRLAIILWLIASCVWAQEVTITGLERPIKQGSFRIVRVTGIDDEQLNKATVTIEPPSDSIAFDRSSSNPRQWFVGIADDATPGKHVFSISLNPFRSHLDTAARLIQNSGVEEADAKEVADIAKKMSKYAHRYGSAVLEVTGTAPFDPTKPDPPKPPVLPPNVRRQVTYVYERENNPVPRQVAAALNRLNADPSGSFVATEIDDDIVDGTGNTPDQYVVAVTEARKAGLPALVVNVGLTVLRVIKNPTTDQAVFEAAKQ